MLLNYLLVLSIHSLSSLGITPNSPPWVICLHSGWLPNKLSGSVFISYHPSSLQHFSLQCSSVSQQRLTHAPTPLCQSWDLFILPAPNSSDTLTGSRSSIYTLGKPGMNSPWHWNNLPWLPHTRGAGKANPTWNKPHQKEPFPSVVFLGGKRGLRLS